LAEAVVVARSPERTDKASSSKQSGQGSETPAWPFFFTILMVPGGTGSA
jgi:hypothetical protein